VSSLDQEAAMKMKTALSASGIGIVALAGTACFAGMAGAATPARASHHAGLHAGHHVRREALVARIESIAEANALPGGFSCTKASVDQAKITVLTSKIDARLSRAQTAEQNAITAGHGARASAIARRIAAADVLVTDLHTVSGLITAQCG
jgi:hypothetical protein